MKKIQTYLKNHPFIFAIVALVMSRIAGGATITLVQLVKPDYTVQDELGWLLMVVYASVVVSLVYWTDTAAEVGLKPTKTSKEWLLCLPLLSIPLFILVNNGVYSWGTAQNLVLFIAAIGVSVNEEVLFRGILLRGFMKWGPWIAIFVPSALFALLHSTNIFVGGDPTFAIFQTIWTFVAGVMLSALRLRTNSLYPVIVLHILIDGVEYFSTGEYGVHPEAMPTLTLLLFAVLMFILAIYTVILFYRSTIKQNSYINLKDERTL
ncbi:CPBP family intramembrane metalloprotease [Bacillus luteolus]|uniref:CPBP family intramembrane metalloprotease n=1 Tax=Litchfieldia luteola TaxID=682179 RepID=A0ABR9QH61_9BACI|nr:CPBP family intramembrane glutamic endopeptidase [Cytobacillus luteolus]MBE4907833.1 CPBP family intramembrane metalloprotease [Cytobacillus luteolus]MBP1944010.1 membrane protease YdiL (CAAX protease family) [Cytobacillus luteolus]